MTKNRKLIWKLYPSFLLVTLISLISVTGYTVNSIRQFFLEQNRNSLAVQSRLLEDQLRPFILSQDETKIDSLTKNFKEDINTRITVILPDGKVVGDTLESPRYMDNHANRPEIQTAMLGGVGYSTRFSGTLQQEMMYVARPMKDQGEIKAVIRASVAITSLEEKLNIIQLDRVIWGILTAMIASVICLIISRRISQPIEEMKQGARHFAQGNLKYRLSLPDILEFSSLAESMNQMAADLESRIVTIANQRNEYEAVLSSMVEGVIAVDRNENVININQAAAKMLNINPDVLRNPSIQEMIRNSKMQAYIKDTLNNGRLNVDDIVVTQRDSEIVFNFRSMPLFDSSEEQIGALAVMNDVTRLRLLETMRSDFVANVSHELKTPLTAIKGFVETMIHNSMVESPEEADRFLKTILKNADRLNMIIEDLLSLARIEKLTNDESGFISQQNSIKAIIESAVQVVQVMAEKKSIDIKITNTDTLQAGCDPDLIEQALINLMENAIKYSGNNSKVEIDYGILNNETFISVIDNGPGIHHKHISRLFERFYRADKARSRELGGTGLGLAIVKHITQLHSGRVTINSELGKGSTFTIHLPQ